MDLELRDTIRMMPYRKRNHGLYAAEVYDLGLLIKFINFLIRFADYIPIIPLCNLVLLFTMMLSFVLLNVLCVQSNEVNKVNSANKNRTFDSFTDEECWHNLRFRRDELNLPVRVEWIPSSGDMYEWPFLSSGARIHVDALSSCIPMTIVYSKGHFR